jgi:hypothetical protein
MDFIVGLPLTPRKYDSIWVIVDRLTKRYAEIYIDLIVRLHGNLCRSHSGLAYFHFIPGHTTYSVERYSEVYVDLIVRLHRVPKTILSNRGTQFAARFWAQVHESLGTKLIHSSNYHPQTDG